jgi:hypothetical protein
VAFAALSGSSTGVPVTVIGSTPTTMIPGAAAARIVQIVVAPALPAPASASAAPPSSAANSRFPRMGRECVRS